MRISFYNNSGSNMIMTFAGQMIFCSPNQTQNIVTEEGRVSFEVSTDDRSTIKNLSKVAGIAYDHNFITATRYEFDCHEDTSIVLSVDKKDGEHFETYTRVIAASETALFSPPVYRVKDEADMRKQLKRSNRKMLRTVGVLGVFGFLEDALAVICGILLIAFVIFVLLFAEETHVKVGVAICAAIVIGIILIINKIAGKLDKWVDKKLSKNKKEETVDISIDVDLYKNKDSYFDADYISSVFGK